MSDRVAHLERSAVHARSRGLTDPCVVSAFRSTRPPATSAPIGHIIGAVDVELGRACVTGVS